MFLILFVLFSVAYVSLLIINHNEKKELRVLENSVNEKIFKEEKIKESKKILNDIDNLNNKIDELNNNLGNLILENNNLSDQIGDYENKISNLNNG